MGDVTCILLWEPFSLGVPSLDNRNRLPFPIDDLALSMFFGYQGRYKLMIPIDSSVVKQFRLLPDLILFKIAGWIPLVFLKQMSKIHRFFAAFISAVAESDIYSANTADAPQAKIQRQLGHAEQNQPLKSRRTSQSNDYRI